MFCLILVEFVAFPERKDAIFEAHDDSREVIATSSGSIGFYKNGRCQKTDPNMTLGKDNKLTDWCSNIVSKDEKTDAKPWIAYHIKNKRIQANSYAIRSGCCYYECCCNDDSTFIDEFCCCSLYSYSLQVSDNNVTWRTIHSVKEDQKFFSCTNRIHKFDHVEEFTYSRIVLDKQRPHCENCFALNKVEFYGSTIYYNGIYDTNVDEDNDESVSIIGKIDRNRAI